MRKNLIPKSIPYTKEGIEKLKTELEELFRDRKDAVIHVSRAREMGDLSENGYYKSYKAKLAQIDGRIRRTRYILLHVKEITKPKSDSVDIGSTVTLLKGGKKVTYEIVGKDEADPGQGRISYLSPLGKALIGGKCGGLVVINSLKGELIFKILKVS